MKSRICLRCEKEYIPTGYNQKYCMNCKDIAIKEQKAQYYQDNKEQRAQYRKDNKEQIAQRSKQYKKDNKEQLNQYNAQYYQDNKEQKSQRDIQYYQDNKESYIDRANFRNRNLGNDRLNTRFQDCHGHHITKNFVINIPKELNQSAYHNIWTSEGMHKINKLVMDWFISSHNITSYTYDSHLKLHHKYQSMQFLTILYNPIQYIISNNTLLLPDDLH